MQFIGFLLIKIMDWNFQNFHNCGNSGHITCLINLWLLRFLEKSLWLFWLFWFVVVVVAPADLKQLPHELQWFKSYVDPGKYELGRDGYSKWGLQWQPQQWE